MESAPSYCLADGDTVVPTSLARGPWGETIVGHVVGGLLKFAWIRHTTPLMDREPDSPFVCAAMAADLTSAVAHWGEKVMNYMNIDYTLSISRLPDGPYIGLAALTHVGHDGVASGTVSVFDQSGQIGSGTANAVANPGFRAPY